MKETKAELIERAARLDKENTINMLALNAVMRGEHPDAQETVRISKDEKYVYRLYDAGRSHGGIVVVTFWYAGQSPSSQAYYFEERRDGAYKHAMHVPEHAPHRDALERMAIVARRIREAA